MEWLHTNVNEEAKSSKEVIKKAWGEQDKVKQLIPLNIVDPQTNRRRNNNKPESITMDKNAPQFPKLIPAFLGQKNMIFTHLFPSSLSLFRFPIGRDTSPLSSTALSGNAQWPCFEKRSLRVGSQARGRLSVLLGFHEPRSTTSHAADMSYVCPCWVWTEKIVCGQWRGAQSCRGASQTLRRVGSCCGVCRYPGSWASRMSTCGTWDWLIKDSDEG